MSNCHFGWELALQEGGGFFQVGLKNSVSKIVNMNPKQKIYSKCSFNNLTLVPYPNNFLVVCICILFFHGVYSTNIFLWRDNFFFLVLSCQISWSPSILGGPNFLFGRRGQAIFFHEAINNQSVNSRIVDGKIICSMCTC